jgi:hypothetical protein
MQAAGAGLILLLLVTSAGGHENWPSGEPVQDWVKMSCCGMSEAHRFEQSQVHHLSDGGWQIDGFPWIVRIQPLPSPAGDDAYWLFYSTGNGLLPGAIGPIICFFAPTFY